MIQKIKKRWRILIKYIFLVLMLVSTIAIIRENNNFRIIIYFSVLSLLAASLYFFNHAPDVALAEIAVGSAFIPLIFIIAISKQRTFTVMSNLDDEFPYLDLIIDFCKEENLKLKIINEKDVTDDEGTTIQGVFRRIDIDLILNLSYKKDKYYVAGKKSNIMIDKIEKITKDIELIKIVKIEDKETTD